MVDDDRNSRGKPLPLSRLMLEGATTVACERVVLCPPVVFAVAPLRLDPPLLLQLVQRRVERSLSHLQDLIRHLADALRDRPAVHRLERDHFQNQKVQRALNEICRLAHEWCTPVGYRQENTPAPVGNQGESLWSHRPPDLTKF